MHLKVLGSVPHGTHNFSLSHACDKMKNIFLYLSTELKTCHLSYSIYKIYLSMSMLFFFNQTRANLQILGITASNTWGLLLLVFLMGYGLVEVPRTTWNTARLELQMAHAYFKISKLSVEKEEADEQFSEVLEVARTAASLIILSSRVVCVLSLQ